MFTIKLKKKEIRRHNGTMTVDVSFSSDTENFVKSFEFPIYATFSEVKKEIKTWIEDFEENNLLTLDPEVAVDMTDVVTDRVAEREYRAKKAQLAEMQELVALGALSSTDTNLKALQTEVKDKYKPKFIKTK